MAVFGKAIGNGYAITAVLGKKEVMENDKVSRVESPPALVPLRTRFF